MREVLWHSWLRKARWDVGVVTGVYHSPGIAGEGAKSADPQDLHDVVKAALLEVQFPVGPSQAHRQSA
jgi:hypothetical protein